MGRTKDKARREARGTTGMSAAGGGGGAPDSSVASAAAAFAALRGLPGVAASVSATAVPSVVSPLSVSPSSSTSSLPAASASQEAMADFDSAVDPASAQALRALWKKDPVTKLKALQSLLTAATERQFQIAKEDGGDKGGGEASQQALVWVLPLLEPWARSYGRLVFDADRRVRVTASELQAQLVSLAGREIAPYLRAMLGPWLCAQTDSARDASAAAKQALVTAFGQTQSSSSVDVDADIRVAEKKISAALWFARKALASFFLDNFAKTRQQLIDSKVSDEERVCRGVGGGGGSRSSISPCIC
jgi:E3 ubiquitin-protein ligase listerin, N-terminal domain